VANRATTDPIEDMRFTAIIRLRSACCKLRGERVAVACRVDCCREGGTQPKEARNRAARPLAPRSLFQEDDIKSDNCARTVTPISPGPCGML